MSWPDHGCARPRNRNVSKEEAAATGTTPLVVADGATVVRVVVLADILKPGIRERFAHPAEYGAADRHDYGR